MSDISFYIIKSTLSNLVSLSVFMENFDEIIFIPP